MTDDNMMVLRRSITTISTDSINGELATNFVLIREWMHLDEDENSDDFRLPRTISIFDFEGNQLKIGRVKTKAEIGIDTDEEDIAIYATDLTDGAVHEMIHKFVRRGLEKFLEHRLENDTSDDKDEWDFEDKVKCVTDYILKTYVMDYYDSDESTVVQVMKDVFGDVESRCGLGNPNYSTVQNLTQSQPHLLIVTRKVQDVSPIIEKKKKFYPDGSSDWDATTYEAFDFNTIPDGVDVFQIVWAKN